MRDFTYNEAVMSYIERNDKRPGAVADKAGIRRDVFSKIIHSRRPMFAEEIEPICNALGIAVSDLVERAAQMRSA